MPKFAVYFIPRVDDPFYQLGSQVLGYDVRNRQAMTLPAHLMNPFRGADPVEMASRLAKLSESYAALTIESVCLLVQEDHNSEWFIYRELDVASRMADGQADELGGRP